MSEQQVRIAGFSCTTRLCAHLQSWAYVSEPEKTNTWTKADDAYTRILFLCNDKCLILDRTEQLGTNLAH